MINISDRGKKEIGDLLDLGGGVYRNLRTGKLVRGSFNLETGFSLLTFSATNFSMKVKADVTGLSAEEKVFTLNMGDKTEETITLDGTLQTITHTYTQTDPVTAFEIKITQATKTAITEIEFETTGTAVDLNQLSVFVNVEIIKVVNDVSGITDFQTFGDTFASLRELYVDTVLEYQRWIIPITGQDTATQTNGTLVFSATADVVVEVTGDVTLVSTTKADDDIYRSHTVLFNITRNGIGTIRVKEAVKVVSLGNHNGASLPNVQFYAGTIATCPILTVRFEELPKNVTKLHQIVDQGVTLIVPESNVFLANLDYMRLRGQNIGWTYNDVGYLIFVFAGVYYEMAKEVLATAAWSNVDVALGTTSYDLGQGRGNTDKIIAQAGHTASAAKVCDDYAGLSKSDWYLPSINETTTIFHRKHLINSSALIWSSNEFVTNNSLVLERSLSDGSTSGSSKSTARNVIPIRHFTP